MHHPGHGLQVKGECAPRTPQIHKWGVPGAPHERSPYPRNSYYSQNSYYS
jgi:hypothetical protein